MDERHVESYFPDSMGNLFAGRAASQQALIEIEQRAKSPYVTEQDKIADEILRFKLLLKSGERRGAISAAEKTLNILLDENFSGAVGKMMRECYLLKTYYFLSRELIDDSPNGSLQMADDGLQIAFKHEDLGYISKFSKRLAEGLYKNGEFEKSLGMSIGIVMQYPGNTEIATVHAPVMAQSLNRLKWKANEIIRRGYNAEAQQVLIETLTEAQRGKLSGKDRTAISVALEEDKPGVSESTKSAGVAKETDSLTGEPPVVKSAEFAKKPVESTARTEEAGETKKIEPAKTPKITDANLPTGPKKKGRHRAGVKNRLREQKRKEAQAQSAGQVSTNGGVSKPPVAGR